MLDTDKINAFAVAMLEAAELDDLLWSIARNVGETLGFEDCVIYLNENNTLIQMAAFGIKNPVERKLVERIEIPVGSGIVGTVAKTGIAEIIADTSLDNRYIRDQFSGNSELAVPIIYDNQVIGIIDSEASTKNAYQEKDQELLQIIANIASPRIISARYCRQLKSTQRRLIIANQSLERSMSDLKRNQQSLVYSEKMASVGLLAAGVAHEINNPLAFSLCNLSTLSGYIDQVVAVHNQLLKSRGLSTATKNILTNENYAYILGDAQSIIRETNDGLIRIKGIVTDLCGYVRDEDKSFTYIDINEGLRATLNLLSNEIKQHCTLHINLGELPHVLGNRNKINQVFMNIVLNAIQASPEWGQIRVSSFSEAKNVIVEISDNGPGIPKKHLKDIFTPFYTTKPVGKGTGLGLFICYRIIAEEHCGAINVDSNNKGTTFRIVLPRPGS